VRSGPGAGAGPPARMRMSEIRTRGRGWARGVHREERRRSATANLKDRIEEQYSGLLGDSNVGETRDYVLYPLQPPFTICITLHIFSVDGLRGALNDNQPGRSRQRALHRSYSSGVGVSREFREISRICVRSCHKSSRRPFTTQQTCE
jgi:hypothetical protein